MKPSQAAEIVAVLIATYPWVTTSTSTSTAYERGLIDLDYAVADAALERVIATHAFGNRLPTVAEIREAALAVVSGERRAAGDAWGDVQALLRRGFSSHRAPTSADVEDPLVFQALQAIGWRAICLADEDDPAPRARFCDHYDQLAAASRRDRLTRTLPAVAALRQLRAVEEDGGRPAIAAGELARGLAKRLGGGR